MNNFNIEDIAITEIRGMRFSTHTGCFEEEKAEGVELEVDFRGRTDVAKASRTDDLANALDVNRVHAAIAIEMAVPCNLLESLSHRVCEAVAKGCPELVEFDITIRKRRTRLAGEAESWSITRHCSR